MSGVSLSDLRALAEAATPGPWAWFGNTQMNNVYLATRANGRRFVMQFRRWGMSSAQPMFRDAPGDDGLMVDASKLVRYEVLNGQTIAEAGKEPYRYDIVGLDNPDAAFIAACSPETILGLVEVAQAAQAFLAVKPGEDGGDWDPADWDEWTELVALREALASLGGER